MHRPRKMRRVYGDQTQASFCCRSTICGSGSRPTVFWRTAVQAVGQESELSLYHQHPLDTIWQMVNNIRQLLRCFSCCALAHLGTCLRWATSVHRRLLHCAMILHQSAVFQNNCSPRHWPLLWHWPIIKRATPMEHVLQEGADCTDACYSCSNPLEEVYMSKLTVCTVKCCGAQ